MRIRGGHTVEVYRATNQDAYGDRDWELIGSIDHVVFQWASAASVGLRFHPDDRFQETTGLSAVMFVPRGSTPAIEPRDRLKFNGETYQVVGDRAWDENHPVTNYNFGHYMVQVEVTS